MYNEYLFYHFNLSMLRRRLQYCKEGIAQIDATKEMRMQRKEVPTQTSEEIKDRQTFEKEVKNIQHDIDILDPLMDEITVNITSAIESRTGKKFRTLRPSSK